MNSHVKPQQHPAINQETVLQVTTPNIQWSDTPTMLNYSFSGHHKLPQVYLYPSETMDPLSSAATRFSLTHNPGTLNTTTYPTRKLQALRALLLGQSTITLLLVVTCALHTQPGLS
jgi:hypothetical protein